MEATTQAEKVLKAFDRGVVAHGEALTLLVMAAADHPPAELAAALDGEWLEHLEQALLPTLRISIGLREDSELAFVEGVSQWVDFFREAGRS
jgi:hypothetical protein